MGNVRRAVWAVETIHHLQQSHHQDIEEKHDRPDASGKERMRRADTAFYHHAPSCRMACAGVVGNSSKQELVPKLAALEKVAAASVYAARTQSGFDSRHAWPRDA